MTGRRGICCMRGLPSLEMRSISSIVSTCDVCE